MVDEEEPKVGFAHHLILHFLVGDSGHSHAEYRFTALMGKTSSRI
jgi:hypothetical protein